MIKLLKFLGFFLIFFAKFHFVFCNENLFISPQKQVFYIESGQKFTWFDALTKCAKMNMSLITIDTKSKSEDVTDLLKNVFGKRTPLWIGGVINGDNPRQFVWSATGRKFTYTNWSNGQPDFAGNNEYCAQTGWTDNMEWNDHVCTLKFGFMCEYSRYHHCQNEIDTRAKDETKKTELKTLLGELLPDGRTFRDLIFNINSNGK
ncbi:lectin subunit alpha-like [Cochliomyia hominivorax]